LHNLVGELAPWQVDDHLPFPNVHHHAMADVPTRSAESRP
jgi:hypothetical protein